jgi:dTDP-4-dehydrorhamnose reductase
MILMFGGSGQLGRELVRTAAAQGRALRSLDRAAVDIADADAVNHAIVETGPTLVVNAAAYTKVDLAETESDAAARANSLGPAVLADACAAAGVPLIHVSTDYVFDGEKLGAYVESDPVAPLGTYGKTKAEGERAVRERLQHHLILRTAWVYSEFGNNFLKTIVRLARERDELRVVADQRGCPTSTRDLAAASLHIAPRLAVGDGEWGTYHFAGSGETTWHGFAERIVTAQAPLTGRRPEVKAISTSEYPTPVRRPANSVLDSTRFANVFGIRAHPWMEEADAITAAVVGSQQSAVRHGA